MDDQYAFLAGLVAFLCGHLLYAVAFLHLPGNLWGLVATSLPAMVLLVFTLVNLALIRIKRRGPPPAGVRAIPLWVPVLGTIASVGILLAAV